MPCRARLSDGDEADDAESGFRETREGREGMVLTEDRGEAAAGGGEGGRQVGRKGLAIGQAVHDPFEGDAVVEGENLAEALDEFLVAHGGGVADADAVVAEPAFHAAFAGTDEFLAAGEGGAEEGAVEGGIEVGQAGSEAQAGRQVSARGCGPLAFEVGGGGLSTEGGGVRALFADADLAGDFVEDPHADFAEGEGGEDGGRDGEEDGEEAVGTGTDEIAVHAVETAEGGGGAGEGCFHGRHDGGIVLEVKDFSVISQDGRGAIGLAWGEGVWQGRGD